MSRKQRLALRWLGLAVLLTIAFIVLATTNLLTGVITVTLAAVSIYFNQQFLENSRRRINGLLDLISSVAATPRSWRLLGYLIPPKARREMYEPSLELYIQDYHVTRKKYRTKWAKGWLKVCYTLWTLYLTAQCLLLMLSSPLVKLWVQLTGLTYGQKDD